MLAHDYGFTANITVIRNNLGGLRAMGGGDGPEAQAAATGKALNMPWKENTMKVVVLITDAPPRGIGELGDHFPQGSPDGQDPLNIARQMAKRGIVLHVVACEPTLSLEYSYASEFYQALADLTSGLMLPLLSADKLPDYILGASLETAALESLLTTHAKDIKTELNSSSVSVEDYAEKLYKRLNDQGIQVDSVQVADSYVNSEDNEKNIATWMESMIIDDARGKIILATTSRLPQPREPSPRLETDSPGVLFEAAEVASVTSSSTLEPYTVLPPITVVDVGPCMAAESVGSALEYEAPFSETDEGSVAEEGPIAEETSSPPERAIQKTLFLEEPLCLERAPTPLAAEEGGFTIPTVPPVVSAAIQKEQVLRLVRQAQARSTWIESEF